MGRICCFVSFLALLDKSEWTSFCFILLTTIPGGPGSFFFVVAWLEFGSLSSPIEDQLKKNNFLCEFTILTH